MKRTKDFNTNKGITLIALVITIIVMLILVGVTISMAVNGGLFNYAENAVGETKNALDAEQELANGRIKIGDVWYNSIDEYLNGIGSGNQTPKALTISGPNSVEYKRTITLTVKLGEEEIPPEDVEWTCSADESIMTVNNGVVTGVNYTEQFDDNGNSDTFYATITVKYKGFTATKAVSIGPWTCAECEGGYITLDTYTKCPSCEIVDGGIEVSEERWIDWDGDGPDNPEFLCDLTCKSCGYTDYAMYGVSDWEVKGQEVCSACNGDYIDWGEFGG